MSEQVNIIVPSDETSRKAILAAMEEMSNSMMRVAAEQSLQKEIGATIKEKYQVPLSVFNKMSRIHFKRNVDAVEQEADELCNAYKLIAGKKDDQTN